MPSPVAAGLLSNFINIYMYEWDAPKAERQLQAFRRVANCWMISGESETPGVHRP